MNCEQDIIRLTDRLRRLCSRREYCRSDILKKAMTSLDGNKEQAQKILDVLVSERYVDDRRYSAAYAREKAMISGWGETKIRYMLSAKRVDREVIDQALMEIDADKADSRLKKLLENKAKTLRKDPQAHLKLIRFALGRGYKYDDVAKLITSLTKE